jgi:hypothetical protein
MAYGLEIFSNNDTLQLGTTVQESLSITDSGTANAAGFYATVPYNGTNEILCFNRSTTGWLTGTTNAAGTSWTNSSGTAVNWIKLRRMTESEENETNNYGLKIFDAQGSSTTYSTAFSFSQEVLNVKSPGTVSSTSLAEQDTPVIYTGDPIGEYVGVGRMYYGASTSQYDAYENLYFDTSNNVIRSRNLVGFDIGNGWNYIGRPNRSSLIVFKRKGL